MLTELRIEELGVIPELTLGFGPGMTALTGETGAGKTMLVEAIELLVGGRADTTLVREGAREARVEGRFVVGDDELVLARVVPADGRSRAYVNGRLATVGLLAEEGARLVDLHGQHTHQSLLASSTQREALDAHAAVDKEPLRSARGRLAEIDAQLAALGGDGRARAREIDLLRFQVHELTSAGLDDPAEDDALEQLEDTLADAVAHQEAAARAVASLVDEGGALDGARSALAAIASRAPFGPAEARLRAAVAELDDLTGELRSAGEAIEDDPERLASVRARRQLLRELQRKYGDTLAEVIAERDALAARLSELESYEERAAALEAERSRALAAEAKAAAAVGAARRAAAPKLASAVQAHLGELAMAGARLGVHVGTEDPGDDVAFWLAANPGEPAAPLAKVASGGELARTMLALRLVLSTSGDTGTPGTLVFDEVDAGIGGEAALAVGRALAALGRRYQVLVVTHLAQVAAFADAQVQVTKSTQRGRTVAAAAQVIDGERVAELSRMLSGLGESAAGHRHAEELLAAVRAAKAE